MGSLQLQILLRQEDMHKFGRSDSHDAWIVTNNKYGILLTLLGYAD